jgi:uncharacterized protein YegP (UPF0339 family)
MTRWTRGLIVVATAGVIGIGMLSPTVAQDEKPKKGKMGNVTLTFEVYKDAKEEFRWRLKSRNGQIIGTSGAGYKDKSDCKHGIELIQKGAAKAEIKEITDSEK